VRSIGSILPLNPACARPARWRGPARPSRRSLPHRRQSSPGARSFAVRLHRLAKGRSRNRLSHQCSRSLAADLLSQCLTAQAGILAVSLCALVLAALFSERRESEASLARSNMMLQRERNNKLMNLEAMAASIAHEVRQPLAAIATSGNAALRFIGRSPPNLEEVRSALDRMLPPVIVPVRYSTTFLPCLEVSIRDNSQLM
jgi:signal transduction histidine kinase